MRCRPFGFKAWSDTGLQPTKTRMLAHVERTMTAAAVNTGAAGGGGGGGNDDSQAAAGTTSVPIRGGGLRGLPGKVAVVSPYEYVG